VVAHEIELLRKMHILLFRIQNALLFALFLLNSVVVRIFIYERLFIM